jgi:hypothetical protein
MIIFGSFQSGSGNRIFQTAPLEVGQDFVWIRVSVLNFSLEYKTTWHDINK